MRNLLALFAAFTLSSSTAVTAVACGKADQSTVVIFDWNGVINGKHNETSTDFFDFLLKNPDSGVGQTLYKDIVDYISLSILKTNPTFSEDYQFAKLSVENQIKNIQDSLKAKYGRSWETEWKKFLSDPAQGGDGKTGSYQRYFDVLLKSKANTIVSQYYVGDNYHNYQYYNNTEISIWLNDMFDSIHNKGQSMADYLANGLYRDKVWIVDKSVFNDDPGYTKLEQKIKESLSVVDIKLIFKVAKTKDDKPLKSGDDYLVDPSNTIKGLLSNQQAKIAQVWMKNQGPIWARQIVIPFNSDVKPLESPISAASFDKSEPRLKEVLDNIQNFGFDEALKQDMGNITSVTTSSSTGDLGLVTLNSDTSNIKASFSYYLYRYVTSEQGVGLDSPTTAQYSIPQYTYSGDPTTLFGDIDRTVYQGDTSGDHTSNYNDIVWMKDSDPNSKYSGANGNKVAIFIDGDGIHFVQTPGITYTPTPNNDSLQNIITNYNQLISNPQSNITWQDASKVADRPGGLTKYPYLDYLQTQYLLWNARNETTYFDLNDSLKKYTSGSTDISSDIWWDYILYFNNNVDNIHWNLPSTNSEVSTLLNANIQAPNDKIYQFISSMKTWFTSTFERRWSLQQGITSTDTLVKNINDLNNTWDGYANGPAARLDANDIKSYLNSVAANTIWWYDPNSIQG